MRVRLTALFVAAVGIAACGSTSAPPPASPPPASDPPAAADSPVEKIHHVFLDGCNKKITAPEYCDCSWQQMQATFTPADMAGSTIDPARMAQFKERTKTECASKLPEDALKAGFVQGCAGDITDLAPYCECVWGAYRTKLSAADLNNEDIKNNPVFVETTKVAVKSCGPKALEAPTKARFLKDCGANPALQPFCACAWTELRKAHAPADVLAGTFPMDEIKVKLDKACGALRPAK
jgi:hypothetical protein